MVEHGEDYDVELPDIFPLDEVIVDDEQHIYRVFEGDFGPLPEEEYTLDKAPIKEIREVTGTIDGVESEFEKGTDYELSADSERILWLNGDRPDPGTTFYVTYRTESIISRYVESGEEELDTIQHVIEDAIEAKFLSSAEGIELDRIGSLFGPVIGKRRGRTDEQYRIYLESVVQSFISRGTVDGIKLAISAATDVPVADITIDEDFENNEYEVIVIPNTPVDVALLEEIAQIADPSGIQQILTRFPVFDEAGVADDASFTEGITLPEDMAVSDSVANFGFGTEGAVFEGVSTDDANAVNANKFLSTEQMAGDDTSAIDPNLTTFNEDLGIADVAATPRGSATEDIEVDETTEVDPNLTTQSEDVSADDTIEKVDDDSAFAQKWETDADPNTTTEWNFFQWTELLEATRTIAEDSAFDDTPAINANLTTTTDTGGLADTSAIDANVTTVADVASTDDAVTVTFNQTATAEDTGSTDAVPTITTQSVAWGTEWNTFNWAKESN